jgi:alkylhydroperoxidase/carboxymuconolactone decarboxylase family protein YurZ
MEQQNEAARTASAGGDSAISRAGAPGIEAMRSLDPTYLDAASDLFGYPRERRALSEGDRAFIEVALDALITQFDASRLRRSIREAAQLGATRYEVLCVLEIAAVIGLHSLSTGVPVLGEELYSDESPPPLTARQREIAHRFESRGLRPRALEAMYESILRLDPDYFERFVGFIDVPWREDVLDPRVKQLVCIAIDVACTHLYVDGIRRHIREALALGVTADEILEVIQLASATGLRTLEASLPILAEVYEGDPETP